MFLALGIFTPWGKKNNLMVTPSPKLHLVITMSVFRASLAVGRPTQRRSINLTACRMSSFCRHCRAASRKEVPGTRPELRNGTNIRGICLRPTRQSIDQPQRDRTRRVGGCREDAGLRCCGHHGEISTNADRIYISADRRGTSAQRTNERVMEW